MGHPRCEGCNSNICMKLSFQRPELSMHALRALSIRPVTLSSSPAMAAGQDPCGELAAGREWPSIFQGEGRGASHGFHDIGTAEGMARARAVVHDQACPARRSRLQAAGRRGAPLESDSDPRGTEEEGEGGRAVEHVPAAIL